MASDFAACRPHPDPDRTRTPGPVQVDIGAGVQKPSKMGSKMTPERSFLAGPGPKSGPIISRVLGTRRGRLHTPSVHLHTPKVKSPKNHRIKTFLTPGEVPGQKPKKSPNKNVSYSRRGSGAPDGAPGAPGGPWGPLGAPGGPWGPMGPWALWGPMGPWALEAAIAADP